MAAEHATTIQALLSSLWMLTTQNPSEMPGVASVHCWCAMDKIGFFFVFGRVSTCKVHYKPLCLISDCRHVNVNNTRSTNMTFFNFFSSISYLLRRVDGSLWGDVLRHQWCVKLCLKVLGNSAPHLITAINSTYGIPYFLHSESERESVKVWRHLWFLGLRLDREACIFISEEFA